METTKKRNLQFLDIYLSAYLALCGIPPTLEKNNGKVVFVFPASEDVYRLMSDFNSDVNVPIASFVTQIKALRGQMLTMRGQR